MSGNERVRHCTLCELNVYNFAELTRAEISDLLQRTEGRVCARLFRRPDGTLLTRDCPSGLQRVRARVSRWKSALIAAVFSAWGVVTGCATTAKPLASTRSSPTTEAPAVVMQESVLEGVVVDETGACLPDAWILLRDKGTGYEQTLRTDGKGWFALPLLGNPEYSIEVIGSSSAASVRDLRITQREQLSSSASSLISGATVGIVVSGELGMEPGFATSTRFTKTLMDKLPLF
ncbi:MAG TPA: carboxypeptidase-like regulatory domain-containing protein [Thermoanaerobaculia bacterium]